MRKLRQVPVLAFLLMLAPGHLMASQTQVDQGAPGLYGPWPVLCSSPSDGGGTMFVGGTVAQGDAGVQPWLVNDSAGFSVPASVDGEVACNTSAQLVGGLAGRRAIFLQNNNQTAVNIGLSSGVTTSTGIVLAGAGDAGNPGGSITYDVSNGITIYCISSVLDDAGFGLRFQEIK